jgi:peptidyl-prolyl cis-trans isomerase SurA
MTERPFLTALVLALGLICASSASAQPLRTPGGLNLPITSAPSGANRTADYIVALVNSEPLTNHEVRQRLRQVEQNIAQRGISDAPSRNDLLRQVVDQLINERAQLHLARETGLRVSDAEIDQAEQNIAAQNQMSHEEFRRRLASEGYDIQRFRTELRQQQLLQRLREREVDSRVRVTDADVDAFMAEQQGAGGIENLELNLSHVLVLVPENASPEQRAERQARAQRVADRARAGEDFATLAREFSDAAERVDGGSFGWRAANRLPELFVNSTRNLAVGAIAGPLRSEAGYHLLKVNDKRRSGMPAMSVTQTLASHILLRPTAQLTPEAALARLADYRQRIAAGTASFEALAREHSQDGSAANGGSLGWALPGQFVPEFEDTMNRLRPGEVSEPIVSRFGVHLIRVDQRRNMQLDERQQRERMRMAVREQKLQEATALWVRDVRSRAYVELREDPQP